MTPLDRIIASQRIAAHPSHSTFVSANAGSGKTRVLTDRVARLLLGQTPPQKILCITFTKAAAAEMADRLFESLGRWALLNDDDLRMTLADLEGPDGPRRDKGELIEARRLFARALETPGGLKIQTIHAFCESVLRRFPLEAGAPPDFIVIEDVDATALLQAGLDDIAKQAAREDALKSDFFRLSARYPEQRLRDMLLSGAKNGVFLKQTFDERDGLDGALAALGERLGVDPNKSADEICKNFISTLDEDQLRKALVALSAGGKQAGERNAGPIEAFFSADDLPRQWAALSKLFLKTDGAPRGKYGDATTNKAAPWLNDYLLEIEARFADAENHRKSLTMFHDTAAYYRILDRVRRNYAEAKMRRAALDFDDLIIKTQSLFKNADAAWIMYKLDYGVDHVLIDEAQDTSPAQWDVIENLLKDFLSGAGARDVSRTFFAVGDMKQSIYSFQGADAGLFKEKEIDLGKRLDAVSDYRPVDLSLSFRTTRPVLSFVDQLFTEAGAAEGLGDFPVPAHGVRREGEAGLVELWPLAPRPEKQDVKPWDAPVDEPAPDHPVRVLSDRIAQTVSGWLKDKRLLRSQNRPVAPGDVMILVQSRGKLFEEVIQRLARSGAPVAGADRLRLIEDPAVEDLLSYANFAVSPEDDLALAEILKSPLFGFDDDDDLFPLAYERSDGQTLFAALRARADEKDHWRKAADEIARAQAVGRQFGPYAFFSHILETGAPSGRRRLYTRLTETSRDAIDETLRQTLAFEQTHPRSLRGFIAWFEKNAGDIKREMERASDAVRVMTVHGAKGLEANIVFLIDAHRGPNLRKLGPVFSLPGATENDQGLPLLVDGNDRTLEAAATAREDAQRQAYEEYRRQFYVAATRARDELYICGVELGNEKAPRDKPAGVKSWHALAQDALDRLGGAVETADAPFWPQSEARARRLSCDQTAALKKPEHEAPPSADSAPSWLFAPAAPEAASSRITPSRLFGEEDAARVSEPVYSPAGGADRYFRGRTLHKLLQLLPDIDLDARKEAADRLLEKLAPNIEAGERAAWRDEVLAVINDAQFAPVFAPGSRAEVSIAGVLKHAGPKTTISGQIDRLVIFGEKILVVDYKTNRPPPADIKDADFAYIAQLAAYRALLERIYPKHQIECALLWTYDARLMPVPKALIDHAFARALKTG